MAVPLGDPLFVHQSSCKAGGVNGGRAGVGQGEKKETLFAENLRVNMRTRNSPLGGQS